MTLPFGERLQGDGRWSDQPTSFGLTSDVQSARRYLVQKQIVISGTLGESSISNIEDMIAGRIRAVQYGSDQHPSPRQEFHPDECLSAVNA